MGNHNIVSGRLPAWPVVLHRYWADLGLAEVAWQLALEIGKVTADHSDVETPQDRFLRFAIKEESEGRLDATLRRVRVASVSSHCDVMASLAISNTDYDLEFEWITFAGSLDLDHSLPSP